MDNSTDKDTLIEALLQERDEMYQELSRYRENDTGALEKAEATIKEQADKIKQLTDQLAWYRRKFWKSSTEKYIPEDPNQRKLDFDGLDVLPEEHALLEERERLATLFGQRNNPETLLANQILLQHPNVIVTPHCAFFSREATQRLLEVTMANIEGFVQKKPQNVVLLSPDSNGTL